MKYPAVFSRSLLAATISTLIILPAHADHVQHIKTLDTVLVSAVALDSPNTVVTDLKAPRQPLPAHDGADYLKTIPGFSVTRKGGADGDALFRGMAGSRLGILVDGETILGACNNRMDAPTAYIYPEMFDTLVVIKGPQSVQYGSGNSAATLLFERNPEPFDEPGIRGTASVLVASAKRRDALVDLLAGAEQGYLQITGSDSRADDYKDGGGKAVHSQYHRYSGSVALGWTPNANTKVELGMNRSDGEAAYADRGMDGTRFLRESVRIRVEKKDINEWLSEIKFNAFDSSVDHVMDDQELRRPGMMGYANVARDTKGGRFSATLKPAGNIEWVVGADVQQNNHESRSAPSSGIYGDWIRDGEIKQAGIFTELSWLLDEHRKVVTGYRADRWRALDERTTVSKGMMGKVANPTAGEHRRDTLGSSFARYEHTQSNVPLTWYIGFGHSQRFPDYWELFSKEGERSSSAFALKPEQTRQWDAGLLFDSRQWQMSSSVFYNDIRDFILVDYTSMMKSGGVSRNIDATTYGGEWSLAFTPTKQWKFDASLAMVRGDNDTDNTDLAQIAPLEGRLGVTYNAAKWSVGSLLRLVESQDRYDLNRGNIVGKDLGPSSGFGILSLNAAWKVTPDVLASLGVDNLFDRQYNEFISRTGSNGMGGAIQGYEQTFRVNEPGRTFWLKLQASF
jgi:iron complex outermembrane receptor protein